MTTNVKNLKVWTGLGRLCFGWSLIAVAICLPALATFAAEPAVPEEKFDTLAVGSQVYSNVSVVSRSRNQVTIIHAGGMTSLKLADLNPESQAKLGYSPEENRIKAKGLSLARSFTESDQVREARAKAEELLSRHGETARLGAAIGLPLLYLFTCFCFLHLCRKAGAAAPVKVWVPLLQFDPLFKAADMSRVALFWFLSPLLFALGVSAVGLVAYLAGASPDLLKEPKLIFLGVALQALLSFASLMIGLVWCFKVCIARGKHALLGVFLIFPLTSLLMLCYLAFSGGAKPGRKDGRAGANKAGATLKFA